MAAVRVSPMLRLGWWVHRILFRASGGRIGRRMNGFGILLLVTRGRRSGARRDASLQFLPHDGGWAIVASYAGEDRHPAWWLNLSADPEATVLLDGATHRIRAREAQGAERDALLARFVAIDPAYAEYAERTMRRIPVAVLEPQGTV